MSHRFPFPISVPQRCGAYRSLKVARTDDDPIMTHHYHYQICTSTGRTKVQEARRVSNKLFCACIEDAHERVPLTPLRLPNEPFDIRGWKIITR